MNAMKPDGARMAVVLYTSLEEWAWDRIEPLTPHGTLSMPGEKVPNLGMRSAVSYGFHIGLKRLRDIWRDHGLTGMLWVTGNAAEQHPEVVAEFADLGHEVGGHGYSEGTPPTLMTCDEQRVNIQRTVECIERVTGRRPEGWISAGALVNQDTIELLAEHGFEFDADLQDDELPYFIDVKGKTLVEVPFRMVGNVVDLRLWSTQNRYPLDDALRYLTTTFDAYYREAAVRPLQLNFGSHPFVVGRPDAAWVFAKFLDHMQRHDDVWITNPGAVARHWRKRFGAGYDLKRSMR